MAHGLLQGLFDHSNSIARQSEPTRQPPAPPPPRPADVGLVCTSSSSGDESPHSPAFSPTQEDVDFVLRYTLNGRAIAFRWAQYAASQARHG